MHHLLLFFNTNINVSGVIDYIHAFLVRNHPNLPNQFKYDPNPYQLDLQNDDDRLREIRTRRIDTDQKGYADISRAGYIALRHSDGSEIRYFSPEWKGNMMIHNALLDPRLQQEDALNVATILRNSEFLLSNLVRKKEDKERWIYKYLDARHQIEEANLHPELTHRYLYNIVQPRPNIR